MARYTTSTVSSGRYVSRRKKSAFAELLSPFEDMDPLGLTLLISFALHLIIIIALKFEPPELKKLKDTMMHLDVVLVNAKTKSKPLKADALAQANLDRGGNTDANRQMKSNLPTKNQKVAEAKLKQIQEAEQTTSKREIQQSQEEKRVAELEKQAQTLMTQVQSMKTVSTQDAKSAKKPEQDTTEQAVSAKTLSTADMVAMALEMEKLEAQIAKQQDEYQKRPKRKFLGARTQEYRFALYVEAWRQKVEKIGNLNYPEEAKSQKLYGQLRMTVSIKSDGSLESIEVNQSSGFRVLDNAAKRIVELGAPYAAFPDDIKKDTDIISITRTWTFTKQDSLATE